MKATGDGGQLLLGRLSTLAGRLAFTGPDVHIAAAVVDDHADELFDHERKAIVGAIATRVMTYSTGRRCARQALERLGHMDVCLPRTDSGAAAWPTGMVGSITHTETLAAAVASRSDHVVSVGIDVERVAPLDDGLQSLILNHDERKWLDSIADIDVASCLPTVLFSLKESLYKCLDPLARSWFGFDEASIDVSTMVVNTATASTKVSAHQSHEAVIRSGDTGTVTLDMQGVGFGVRAENVCQRVRTVAGDDALELPRLQGRVLLLGDHVITMVMLLSSTD